MLGSKEIDTIKKEREEKLLQGFQSENCLKARVGATKADGTALTFTAENVIKKTVNKRISIPFDSDFFKHPLYPYLHEDLIV